MNSDSDRTRQLSSEVFQKIKPYCSSVSELAFQPLSENSDTLTYALRQISTELATHYSNHTKNSEVEDYALSTKLADYVFFPLSNLLKQPSLPESVVQYLLEILGFLVKNAWSHDIDENLLEQLLTLSVFLAGGDSISQKRASVVAGKSETFVLAVNSCLVALVKCIPRDFFMDKQHLQKRLSLLGDITTISLDVLDMFLPGTEDEMNTLLHTLAWLYATRVSAEQTSFVFPGIVSKVINFHSKAKNLPSSTLLAILEVLKALIIKVFSDNTLNISVSEMTNQSSDLPPLSTFFENSETQVVREEFPVQVSLSTSQNSHRTTAWLEATSKQLKISLLIFMKNLILTPSSTARILANRKLADGIIAFVTEIVRSCFKALFKEVIPSTFDVLSALFYVMTKDQNETTSRSLLPKIESVYLLLSRTDLTLLYKQLVAKTENLISSQLPPILSSLSEDKICLCISALKIHLHVISSLNSALLKNSDTLNKLSMKILETLAASITQNSYHGERKSKSGSGKKELLQFLGGETPSDQNQNSNTLDEIELPPHIDAKKLATVNKRKDSLVPVGNTNIARRIDLDLQTHEKAPLLFGTTYSKNSEQAIQSLVLFIGEHCSVNFVDIMSSLLVQIDNFADEIGGLAMRSVSLWISNSLYRSSSNNAKNDKVFDMNDFLEFDDSDSDSDSDSTELNNDEDSSYLLLQTAQDMLEDTKALLDKSEYDTRSKEYQICETAYTVALETIGRLSNTLTKEEFQTDVLMDYLYPLLEALTYTPNSQVYLQARVSLGQIVNTHYNGSLENLVNDNADYLIDSLSMNLSVASGLTPSLPGILLVVIRISGVQLLLSNQLQDILSEIFIVIDSFHGYSTLVENFFQVFEEIVLKVKEVYAAELSDSNKISSDMKSPYKPWGMSSLEDVLLLIDDANKLVDPFADYDPEKEYFQRKPGVPFGEQLGDSDDEEEGEEEESQEKASEEVEQWSSPIPKNIYTSIQQLFTYGLQLLSHPSTKLKIQILRTLKEAYPIMSSNYKALMPLLAQYWPLLLVMSTGSTNLVDEMEISTNSHPQADQLIVPTLDFMIRIFDEDRKHEKFMASRFIDMWEFMKKKVPAFLTILDSEVSHNNQVVAVKLSRGKKFQLYSTLYVRGIEIYEKAIPDLVAHEMVKVCYGLGIDESEDIGREVQNHLWVLKHMY